MDNKLKYSVILTFTNDKDIGKYINVLPIAHRGNGSIVAMKDSQPWLDYHEVTSKELKDTFKYIFNKSISMRYKKYV